MQDCSIWMAAAAFRHDLRLREAGCQLKASPGWGERFSPAMFQPEGTVLSERGGPAGARWDRRIGGRYNHRTTGPASCTKSIPRVRIQIESKQRARERGVLSPDRAEALMLALGKPCEPYAYYTINNPPVGKNRFDEEDRPSFMKPRWPRGRVCF